MKFTEGYWEKNERANASYAMQAFTAEAIPGGMRIVSPFRQITDRGGALDVGTITTEFISVRKDIISVRSYHYEGYVKGEPRYELNEDPQETEVEITEDEAVMKAGRMTVRVDLKDFKITYEADGKVLTNIGFRNLGYMQYDRATLTKFPEPNYMAAQYQPYMVTELSLAPGECVYGLGERFTAFVKNGQVVDIWNEDGGTASQISYKNIPFYVTSKHYGVFVDHSDHVSFEVASEKVENVGFSVKGEEIRYHIIYGDDIKGVIENYTDLTGKPALPPAWSFGLWLSTSFTTNYDEKTTNSFIQGMADRDIPLSVFHFDCFWMKALHWCDFEWNNKIFPEPAEMLKRYKERGLKICVWINPYIAQNSTLFAEGKEKGYVTTMFGRRRPIPELKSGNFMQRSFGERVAMNSPIQGTAADIIKIAMNRVYRRLKDENLKSRLVLQVHDELLIETCKEEIPQVSAILEEEMKGAAKLSVELEVDMHQGNNWYEAK